MEQWRLLDTGRLSAAGNMALDEVLLKAKARGGDTVPNTIRFLQMSNPAVLIGFNQNVEQEVRTGFCQERNIDINRRITGGGAIFFDRSQLGWEIICDRSFMNMSIANVDFFGKASQPLINALGSLGIDACFRPRNDIEVNGRKISGTGGTEEGNALLFQGTLLVDFDVDSMLRSLRVPIEKLKDKEIESVKDRVTCLAWEINEVPAIDELKSIIGSAFEEEFGISLQKDGLSPGERSEFASTVDHFTSSDWVHKIRRPLDEQQTISSIHKAKGGLIRVSMQMNMRLNRLQNTIITGDFFSYPRRIIYDLEARLRNVPANRELIKRTITKFFMECKPTIPGITVGDLMIAFDKALDKLRITKHGIPLYLTNHIFSVRESFDAVLGLSPSHLLLPYCSKSLDCGWRYKRDCGECGGCTIHDAYALGRKKNLEIITIQSFEDLMETLEHLKSKGVRAYIGSCCEAFYTKHNEDFEASGLPAILINIDNTTCYDLGKEEIAYEGNFESQTDIKLDLLEMVLDALS